MHSMAGSRNESGIQNISPELLPAVALLNNSAKYRSIGAQIETLSGIFCTTVQEAWDHLVTNDQNMEQVLPRVRERLQEQSGGIGIFIGSAGLASLAPDLRLDSLVDIDVNDTVLGFNARLNQAIVTEAGTLSALSSHTSICRHIAQVLTRDNVADYKTSFIEEEILSEASRFGSEHWSNPANVKAVADSLREKEVTYVTANLSDPRFVTALAAICRQQGQLITFANLTNVHEWIDGSDMSFLSVLPFAPNATVMYSIDNGTPLQSDIAYSLGQYVEAARDSWNPLVDWH